MSEGKKESPASVWPTSAGSYAAFYGALVSLSLEAADDRVAVLALKLQGACNATYGRPTSAVFNGIPIKGVPMK